MWSRVIATLVALTATAVAGKSTDAQAKKAVAGKPTDAQPKNAVAGKPTDAQAKKAAADWVGAMHFGGDAKLEAATALTATTLFAAAYDDEHDLCPAGIATKADAIAKSLECLHDKLEPKGKPKVTRKSGSNLGGPLAKQARKLTELKKTAVVIEIDDGCDGTEHQLLVAVTADKKKPARVAAVLYQAVTCTE